MSSREQILGRLRATRAADDAGSADFPVRRFDWDAPERLRRFRDALEAVRGQVREVGDDWPMVLFELLRDRGVSRLMYGPGGPHGAVLETGWQGLGGIGLMPYSEPVEALREALFTDIDAGFTSARGAIAETGTLVLWPDVQEPRLLSLVPPIHVALVDERSIHSTFAELVDAQNWTRGMPTNALLITGPSKTADIEQTLTYGVHGPKELIVLVRRTAA